MLREILLQISKGNLKTPYLFLGKGRESDNGIDNLLEEYHRKQTELDRALERIKELQTDYPSSGIEGSPWGVSTKSTTVEEPAPSVLSYLPSPGWQIPDWLWTLINWAVSIISVFIGGTIWECLETLKALGPSKYTSMLY